MQPVSAKLGSELRTKRVAWIIPPQTSPAFVITDRPRSLPRCPPEPGQWNALISLIRCVYTLAQVLWCPGLRPRMWEGCPTTALDHRHYYLHQLSSILASRGLNFVVEDLLLLLPMASSKRHYFICSLCIECIPRSSISTNYPQHDWVDSLIHDAHAFPWWVYFEGSCWRTVATERFSSSKSLHPLTRMSSSGGI